MSYRLIILGLLSEQAQYGYELKQIIEVRNFSQYVRLSGGGLYYSLHKLQSEGYIEEQAVERELNYPDRHIYSITQHGRNYLMQLLRETFEDKAARHHYDPIDVALVFAAMLPKAEVAARMRRQLDLTRPELTELVLTQEEFLRQGAAVDPYAKLILNRHIRRLENEIGWLEEAVRGLEFEPAFEMAHQGRWQAKLLDDDASSSQPWAEENEWSEFEEQIHQVGKTYQQKAMAAWQSYEQELKTHPGDNSALNQANLEYQRQVGKAWHEYQQHILSERQKIERKRLGKSQPHSED